MRERWRLLTTNLILVETYALLLGRAGRDTAFRVVSGVRSGTTQIVRVTEADENRAWQIVELYDDKVVSLPGASASALPTPRSPAVSCPAERARCH